MTDPTGRSADPTAFPVPTEVQLPADATDNKNKIRSYAVVLTDADGVQTTVYEQTTVLVDPDGNVVGTADYPITIDSPALQASISELTEAIKALQTTMELLLG